MVPFFHHSIFYEILHKIEKKCQKSIKFCNGVQAMNQMDEILLMNVSNRMNFRLNLKDWMERRNVSIFVHWGDDLFKKRAKVAKRTASPILNEAQAIWHCF